MKFCGACGGSVSLRQLPGEHIERLVCTACKRVHYSNPKIVVGCVAESEDGRILLCRRRIRPRLGQWTFPAGYLECGEASAEGARRETEEESGARVETSGLLAVIDVPQISQVYLIYRGRLLSPPAQSTAESSEIALLSEADLPWDALAFSSVVHALKFFFDDRRNGRSAPHALDLGPIADPSEFQEKI